MIPAAPEPLVTIAERGRAEGAESARARAFSEHVRAERESLAERDPEGEGEAVAPLASVYTLIKSGDWVPTPADVMARLGACALAEISTDPPAPLFVDRLDPDGHTILYGTGGVGKGVITASWIVQLVLAGQRVLILDYEHHPGEWARRIAGLGGVDALAGVVYVAPLTAAWQAKRGPLWVQAEDIRALVEASGATYIVIDSIVPACAGVDPMKPEAVSLYTGALEFIGRPTLSLAHVTKAEDLRYPFGSAFWHHLARMTWSLKRDGERAILAHRKHNNYASLGRFVVTTTWSDDKPGEVWERNYTAALADRVAEALGADALTVAEIVDRLADDEDDDGETVKANSVRTALRRGIKIPQRFTVEGVGSGARYRRIT